METWTSTVLEFIGTTTAWATWIPAYRTRYSYKRSMSQVSPSLSTLQMPKMLRRQRKALRKLKQRINLLLMLSHALQQNGMLDLSNRLLLPASSYHLLKKGLKVELPAWSEKNDICTDSSCRCSNNIQMLKYCSKFFLLLTPTAYLFPKTCSGN